MADVFGNQGECDGDCIPPFRIVTKEQLLEKLDALGCAFNWRLADALERCTALGSVRAHIQDTRFDGCVAEFKASVLVGLLPDALRDWPVWYVRLPDTWSADVTRLAAQSRLVNHVMRDELNPWYVAQWLAIISEFPASGWPADARRLDIDDREIGWMLRAARHSEGLLVMFECSGVLTLTVYPVDEELDCDLQAGDACSSRHPLFDLGLAEVQAMTRALEDRPLPKRRYGSLRLTVAAFDPPQTSGGYAEEWHRAMRKEFSVARVRESSHQEGLIGAEGEVLEWLPQDWTEAPGMVLRLNVPWRFHQTALNQGAIAQVARMGPRGEVPPLVALTLTCGNALYVAEMRLDDSRMVSALQHLSAVGSCRVVLVNELNGRPYALTVPWPCHSYGDVTCENDAPVVDILVATHSGVRRDIAGQLAITTGGVVSLHRCLVGVAIRR